MDELKVNSSIFSVINILNERANSINSDFKSASKDDIYSMDTAVKYADQHENIKNLLDSYKDLIIKDISETRTSFDEVIKKDLDLTSLY